MNSYKTTTAGNVLRAFGSFFANKAFAIALLAVAVYVYLGLDSGAESPIPFIEVFYVGILLGAIIVVAPFLRLVVFPEAAAYAESGQLRKDLNTRTTVSPALLHYWFATTVCYTATILCFTALLNLK